MRLVTYGRADQLFKMWYVIPDSGSLQQSPIISANDLIVQSEQALFTLLQIHRTKGQTLLCGGRGLGVFLFFISIFAGSTQEIIIDHSLLLLECYWVGGLKKFTIQSCSLFLCSTSRKDVSLSNEGQENDHFGTKNVLMRTIKLGIWTHIWQLLCKLPFFAVPLDWIQAGLPVIGSTFWAVCFLEQVVQSITGSSEF